MIESVSQTTWYCLVCGHSNHARSSAEYHWKAEHGGQGEDCANGVDIALGAQLLLMQIRRREWIEREAKKFLEEMHAEFGADDFVAEAEIRDV